VVRFLPSTPEKKEKREKKKEAAILKKRHWFAVACTPNSFMGEGGKES